MIPGKINCWQALACGREPGGAKAEELGICPAAVDATFDGFNQGSKGGRLCWLVAGTFCRGEAQGTFAKKQDSCRNCSFYKQVHVEEGTARLSDRSIDVFAISNKGRVLSYNDDRYLMRILEDGSTLVGIADGLGGEVSGDYAAEIITGRLAGMGAVKKGFETEQLTRFAKESDKAILEESKKYIELEAMGTTLLCAVIREDQAHWVHVGDSRLYLFRESRLLQITEDQTLARFLVKEEEIKPENVSTHYSRNVMDQYIGCGYCDPESGKLRLKRGDLIVLTTDGLHKTIADEKMTEILRKENSKENSIESRARSLLEAALENEGEDNITIVLARISRNMQIRNAK